MNEMQIHSLTAGGAYGTAEIQRFLVSRCKQNSAALINTTLIYIIQRKDQNIIPSKNKFGSVSIITSLLFSKASWQLRIT